MAANTRFSVALHVLAFLARNPRPMPAARLARSVGTHPVVIRRLLRSLSAQGLVRSTRGPLGGAELARKPNEISLLDIYTAVGRPQVLARHRHNRHCPFGRAIRPGLERVLGGLEEGMRRQLRETTLAQAMRTFARSSSSDLL